MPMPVMPQNEIERLLTLSELDLDYSAHQDSFKDLVKLAAKICGTEISLVNLIDSYTQWTVSNHGLNIDQMPREDSVCQYTILGNGQFEITDLSADERFKDKGYVKGEPNLRYYFGVPLQVENGHNIGALCVLDKKRKDLDPEKVELLQIIAGEIVNRLKYLKVIADLHNNLSDVKETQKKVAHDIRGPLSGIIGLAQLISEQGDSNQLEEVLEFINLIHKSGRSILELADEILKADKGERTFITKSEHEFNQLVFKDKLLKLYTPQALNKNINFKVNTTTASESVPFSRNKLLQIVGNLISNAIKFTPEGGSVTVDMDLNPDQDMHVLKIEVKDSGRGLNNDEIASILDGNATSADGTEGETGYGFGLALVKHLVETLKGSLCIYSIPGNGATFEVKLPQK